MMQWLIDVLSWILLAAGGGFVLVGGIGALRMPNLYTRMHAASVTDTMGAVLVLAGMFSRRVGLFHATKENGG